MQQQTRWVCVLVYAGAEWQVFEQLRFTGHRCFYPFLMTTARHGRWRKPIPAPQFPGYLFSAWDLGEPVERLKQTTGVRDLLRQGNDIVVIGARDMAAFARRWRDSYHESFPHRRVVIRPKIGDVVAVPSGAFRGVPARIEAIDKNGAVRASLGSLEVTFHVDALHPQVYAKVQRRGETLALA